MSTYTINQTDDALVVSGDGEPLDLWNELRRYYLTIRSASRGAGGLLYPETTNRDVRAITAVLSRELGRVRYDVATYDEEARRWARVAKRARVAMHGHDDDGTFANNATFWTRDSKHLAVYLSVARHLPTRGELLADFAELTANQPSGRVP